MSHDNLLWSVVEKMASLKPNFNILTFENGNFPPERLTYEDIINKGTLLANILSDSGIGQGERFALLMRNHPEFIYALWAASALGAVVVPIDPRTKGERLIYQLRDSGAKGIFLSAECLGSFEEVREQVPETRLLGVLYKESFGLDVNPRYPNLNTLLSADIAQPLFSRKENPAQAFQIIYTSGTTGYPKGVVIQEDRLSTYALLAKMVWHYREDDILYTGLSLTHGNAHAVTLIPSLSLGIPAVFSAKFSKSRIWNVCREYGCTTFSLLGGMMMGIYSEPALEDDSDNPVRLVLSAGTPSSLWQAFEKRYNIQIHEWYGAVEGGFAHNPPGVGPIGSFGKPLPGLMEMKVVREDDNECSPYELGEIIFRNAMGKTEVEYLGNAKASQEKTRGGWLRTGDIGHTDENGWFFFDFRAGGGLRRQGEFIQPSTVEAAIAEHPDVSDVCVYGIPAASGAPGESDLVAAIVPARSNFAPETFFIFMKEKLDNNLIPSYIQLVSEIPKTISEKNLDRVLRDRFSPDQENVFAR